MVTVGVLTGDAKSWSFRRHLLDHHHQQRQAPAKPHIPSPTEEGLGTGDMEEREGMETAGMEGRERVGTGEGLGMP